MTELELLHAILDSWNKPVVFVDTDHIIRYLNVPAKRNYAKRGDVIGKSIFHCHSEQSCQMIHEAFQKLQDGDEEVMFTSNEKHRVYMRAVRDQEGTLLGYYERYDPPLGKQHERLATDSIEKAKDLFAEGFTCSQSILGAFAPRFGLDADLALKIAGPFGAGMARRGDTCGAVNGALMVIGLAKGSVAASDEDSKKNAYQLAGKFIALFRSHNGSTVCRELLGCDVSNSEELQSARDQGLFRTRCASYLKDSAQVLEDLLGQE